MENTRKENIEEKINLTLESVKGMQRAKANPFLYEKVMNRINSQIDMQKTPSEVPGWNSSKGIKYALIMLLFIALNIATILQISRDTTTVKVNRQTSTETKTQEKGTKGYFDDFINDTGYNNF